MSRNKELILVLGGARSGKSSWAQRYTEEQYHSYLFMATARVLDEEMSERIRVHKEGRGSQWDLIEEPLEIAEALKTRCGHVEAVLVDCLTVWLGNVLLERGEGEVSRYQNALLGALKVRTGAVLLVSNEVGLGIVPESRLGREFRDHAGRLNQRITEMADRVLMMIAGFPLFLKGGSR